MFYLYAYCLDPDKAKPGHEDLTVGPFDGVGITWDFLRGWTYSEDDTDHQFIRHESGFWYPVVLVPNESGWSSMQPDPTRGRYSDIGVMGEDWAGGKVELIPTSAARIAPLGEDLTAAWDAEQQWLDTPEV